MKSNVQIQHNPNSRHIENSVDEDQRTCKESLEPCRANQGIDEKHVVITSKDRVIYEGILVDMGYSFLILKDATNLPLPELNQHGEVKPLKARNF